MSRRGKIDAGNPISSLYFLKKNKRSIREPFSIMESDVVDYSVALKACYKSKIEGHVECIEQMKNLVHRLSICDLPEGSKVIDARVKEILINSFNELQDQILGSKI